MDDNALLMRISRDDHDAFDTLIRRYYPALKSFAGHIVRDDQASADVVQETFVRLWEMRSDVNGIGSVRNYLYVSVRNIAVNHLRTERRLAERHNRMEKEDRDDGFWMYVIEEETRRQISEGIDKLPPRSAMILKLTLQGLSQDQIAREMKISLNTVKSVKAFAINKLRKIIGTLAYVFL